MSKYTEKRKGSIIRNLKRFRGLQRIRNIFAISYETRSSIKFLETLEGFVEVYRTLKVSCDIAEKVFEFVANLGTYLDSVRYFFSALFHLDVSLVK